MTRYPVFAEGEYLGAYLGHPLDPRNTCDLTACEACGGSGEALDHFYTPPKLMWCIECDGCGYFDEDGNPTKESDE